MATLYYTLSRKADKATGLHEVLTRFVVGSRINQRAKTNIFAPADYWNDDAQAVAVPRWRLMNAEQRALVDIVLAIKIDTPLYKFLNLPRSFAYYLFNSLSVTIWMM